MSFLGSNCNYLAPVQLKAMGFNRIETSLGRHMSYEDMVQRNLEDIWSAQSLGMAVTVHLPIFLEASWRDRFDFYDGFFLDPDEALRELAFKTLEDNLIQLRDFENIDYFVLHFPGLYGDQVTYREDFDGLVRAALDRLDALAEAYECQFALEYFTSNTRFRAPDQWVQWLEPYSRLGLLVDTGHLYFGCLVAGYDFDTVLKVLAPHAMGFHLWTVYGEGAYGDSEAYKTFHHIVPNPKQLREEGWAFDTERIFRYLATFNKPLIIEASCKYNGPAYFIESLELLRNMTQC